MADKSRTLDFYIRLIHETGQAVPGLKAELNQITQAAKTAGKEQQAVFENMFAGVGKGKASFEAVTKQVTALRGMIQQLRADASSATPAIFTPKFMRDNQLNAKKLEYLFTDLGKRGAAALQGQFKGAFDSFAKQALAAYQHADPAQFTAAMNKAKLGVLGLKASFESLGGDVQEIFKTTEFGTKQVADVLLQRSLGQLLTLKKLGRSAANELDAFRKSALERFSKGGAQISAADFFGIGKAHEIGRQLEEQFKAGNAAGAADLSKQLKTVLKEYRAARLLTEREVGEITAYYSEKAFKQRAVTSAEASQAVRSGIAASKLAGDSAEIAKVRGEMEKLRSVVTGIDALGKGRGTPAEIEAAAVRLVQLEETLAKLENRALDPRITRQAALDYLKERGRLTREVSEVETRGYDALVVRQAQVEQAATRLYQSFDRLAAVRDKLSEKQLAAAKKPDQLVLAEEDVQKSITALHRYGATADMIIRQARQDFPSLAGMFDATTGSFKLASVIDAKGKETKSKIIAGYKEVTVAIDEGNRLISDQLAVNEKELAKVQKAGTSYEAAPGIFKKKYTAAQQARLTQLEEERAELTRLADANRKLVASQDKQFSLVVQASRDRRLKEEEASYQSLLKQLETRSGAYSGFTKAQAERERTVVQNAHNYTMTRLMQERFWESVGKLSEAEQGVFRNLLTEQMNSERIRTTEFKSLGGGAKFIRQFSENLYEAEARIGRRLEEFAALAKWIGPEAEGVGPGGVARMLNARLKENIAKGPSAIEENGKALLEVASQRAIAIERATKLVLAEGDLRGPKLEAKLAEARRAALGRADVASLIPASIDTPLKTAMFEAFAAGFKIHRGDLGKVLEAGLAKSPELHSDVVETARQVSQSVSDTFSTEFARRGLLVPQTIADSLRTSMRRMSLASKGGKIQETEFKLLDPLIKQALSFNPDLTASEAALAVNKIVGITASEIRKAEGKLSKVTPDFIKGLVKRLGGKELVEGVKTAWSVSGATAGDSLGQLVGKLFEMKSSDQAKSKAQMRQMGNTYAAQLAGEMFDIVKKAGKVTAKIQPQLFDLLSKTFSTNLPGGGQLFGNLLPDRDQFSDLLARSVKSLVKMSPSKEMESAATALQVQLEKAADKVYKTRSDFQKAAADTAKLTGKILDAEREALVKGLGRDAANDAMIRAAGKQGAVLLKRIFETREKNAIQAAKEADAQAARGGLSKEIYDSFVNRLSRAFKWDPTTMRGISARGNISEGSAEAVKAVLRDMALAKPVVDWKQADVDKLVSSALGLDKFRAAQRQTAKKVVDDLFAPILADIAGAQKELAMRAQQTMEKQPQKGPQVVREVDQPFTLLREIAGRQADAAKLGKREKDRYINAVLEQNKQYDEIAKAQGQRAADEAFLAQAQTNEQRKEAIRERMRSSAEQDARDMANLRNIAQQMRDTMSPQEIKAAAAEIRKTNDAMATMYDDIRTGKERGRGRRKLDIESRGPAYTPEELAILKADSQLRREEAAALRQRRKANRERIQLVKAIIAEERRMEAQIAAEKAKAPAPKAAAAAPPVIPPVTPPPAAIAGDADESAKAIGQAADTVTTAVKTGKKKVQTAAAPDKGKGKGKRAVPAVTPEPEVVTQDAAETKHAIEQAGTTVAAAAGKAAEKVTRGKGRKAKGTVLPVTAAEVKAETPPVVAAVEGAGDAIERVVKVVSAGLAVRRGEGRKGSKIFPNIEGEAKAVHDELVKAAKIFKQGQAAVDAGTPIADSAAYGRAAAMIGRVTEALGKAGINMRVLKDGTLGFYNAINLGGAKIQNLAKAMEVAGKAQQTPVIDNIAAKAESVSRLIDVLGRRADQLKATTAAAGRSAADVQDERAQRRLQESIDRQERVERARQKAEAKAAQSQSDVLQAQIDKIIKEKEALANKATAKAEAKLANVQKDPRVLIGMQAQEQLANLDQRFNQLSYRFQHMGWQLGLVGGVMVAGFMKTMQAAAALNKELTKTAAIMEANATVANKKPFEDYYNEAKKAALDWSTTTTFAATEVNQAMLALAQAGQSGKESMLLPKMLEFAAAGDLKLGDAVRSAVSAMTAFKMSAQEVGTVTNAMTVAAISTNAEVQDMADAFKHVGPIAAMAGLGIEQTAAAVGRLSQAGIRGSMAGTGLKRALSELMAPTGKAAKYLHALKIEAMDLSTGTLRSLPDIVDQFRAAFDRLGPSADKAGILMEIFGMRAGPAMVALVNESGDELRKLEKTIVESGGKMAEIAAKQYESLNGYLTRLGNSISNFRAIVGEQTDWGVFKGAVEVLTNLIGMLTRLVDESRSFKIVTGGLLLIAGAVGTLATVGGVLSMLISGLGTLATVVAMFMKGNNLQGMKEIWAELKLLWQTDKTLLRQQAESVTMLGLSVKELNYYMAAATLATLDLQKAQIEAAIAEKEMGLAVDKENAELIANIELLRLRKKAIEEGIVAANARMAVPPVVPPVVIPGGGGDAAKTGGVFSKLFDSIKKSFAGLMALPGVLLGRTKGAAAGIEAVGGAAAKATVGLKGFMGVIGKILGAFAGPVAWIMNIWLLYDVVKMLGGEIMDFVGGGEAAELEKSAKSLEQFKDRFTAEKKPLTVQELIGLKADPEAFNQYQNEVENFLSYWTKVRDALKADVENRQKTVFFVPTELRNMLRAAELQVQTGSAALGNLIRVEDSAAKALGNREAALERIADMMGKGDDKGLGIKGLLGERSKDLDDILASYEEIKSHEEEIATATKAAAVTTIDSMTARRDAVDDLHDAYSTMYRFIDAKEGRAAADAYKGGVKPGLVAMMEENNYIEMMAKMRYSSDTSYQSAAIARLEQYGQERIGLVKFFMQGELDEIRKAADLAKDAEFENMVEVKKLKALIYTESLDQLRKYYKDAAKAERDYEKQSVKLQDDIVKAQLDARAMLAEANRPEGMNLFGDADIDALSTHIRNAITYSDQFNESLYKRNEYLRQGKYDMAETAKSQMEAARSSMTAIKKDLAQQLVAGALQRKDNYYLNRLAAETGIGKEMKKQYDIADRLNKLTGSQRDNERLKIIKEIEQIEQRAAEAAADIPKQQLAAITELRDANKQYMKDLTKTMEEMRDLLRDLSVIPGISMFKAPIEDTRAFNEELSELLNQLEELGDKGNISGPAREKVKGRLAEFMAKRDAEKNPLLPSQASTESAFKALDSSVQTSKGKAVAAVNEVGQTERKWITENADLRDQRTEQSKQKALGTTGGGTPAPAPAAKAATAAASEFGAASERFSKAFSESVDRDVDYFTSQVGSAFSNLGSTIYQKDFLGIRTLHRYFAEGVDDLKERLGALGSVAAKELNDSAAEMERRLAAMGKYPTILQSKVRDEAAKATGADTILQPKARDVEAAKELGKKYGKGIETAMADAMQNLDEVGNRLKGTFTMKDGQMAFVPFADGLQDAAAKSATQISDTLRKALANTAGKGFITQLGVEEKGAPIPPLFNPLNDSTKKATESLGNVPEPANKAATALDKVAPAAESAAAAMNRLAGKSTNNTSETPKTPAEPLAVGGRIDGYGGGDIVPALLEPGEFVLRKEAVRKYGAHRIDALNKSAVPRFKEGGMVGEGWASMLSGWASKFGQSRAAVDELVRAALAPAQRRVIEGADPYMAQQISSDVNNVVGNAAKTLGSMLYETVAHPVEQLEGMGKLAVGAFNALVPKGLEIPDPKGEAKAAFMQTFDPQTLIDNLYTNPLGPAMAVGAVGGAMEGGASLGKGIRGAAARRLTSGNAGVLDSALAGMSEGRGVAAATAEVKAMGVAGDFAGQMSRALRAASSGDTTAFREMARVFTEVNPELRNTSATMRLAKGDAAVAADTIVELYNRTRDIVKDIEGRMGDMGLESTPENQALIAKFNQTANDFARVQETMLGQQQLYWSAGRKGFGGVNEPVFGNQHFALGEGNGARGAFRYLTDHLREALTYFEDRMGQGEDMALYAAKPTEVVGKLMDWQKPMAEQGGVVGPALDRLRANAMNGLTESNQLVAGIEAIKAQMDSGVSPRMAAVLEQKSMLLERARITHDNLRSVANNTGERAGQLYTKMVESLEAERYAKWALSDMDTLPPELARSKYQKMIADRFEGEGIVGHHHVPASKSGRKPRELSTAEFQYAGGIETMAQWAEQQGKLHLAANEPGLDIVRRYVKDQNTGKFVIDPTFTSKIDSAIAGEVRSAIDTATSDAARAQETGARSTIDQRLALAKGQIRDALNSDTTTPDMAKDLVGINDDLSYIMTEDEAAATARLADETGEAPVGADSLEKLRKYVNTIVSKKAEAMADGGALSGYGGGDIVPAVLEPGEFVMRKEAVRKYGSGLMAMLNGLKVEGRHFQSIVRGLRGFKDGGAVTAQPAALSPVGVYNLNLTIGGRTYPLMGEKAVIGALAERLRREGLTTK